MQQSAFADVVETFGVYQHGNIHGGVQLVCTVQNFLADFFALPCIPVGNMVKAGITVFGFQEADFREGVDLAAGIAAQLDALAFHSMLAAAVCAFVQDAVETVGTEFLVDDDFVYLLPTEVVEGKFLLQDGIQLIGALFRDVFGAQQILHIGADLDLAQLQAIVQGIAVESPMGDDGDHGNLHHFHQSAQRVGEGGGGAVKAVACFGEHEHVALVFVQRVFDVADQCGIGDKFVGGDAAQPAHNGFDAKHTNHAVVGGDNIKGTLAQCVEHTLQIIEAGVVHKNQTGLIVGQLFHIEPIAVESVNEHIGNGDQLNELV